MSWVIEVSFDEPAERLVRRAWAALDEAGVRSLAGMPVGAYRPHVTLLGFDDADITAVRGASRPVLTEALGLSLPLTSVGFFPTDEAVAFLGVTPSRQLPDLHQDLYAAVTPLLTGVAAYYEPGSLVPHCTLAVGVCDSATVLAAVSSVLPIAARLAGAWLVQYPTGDPRVELGWCGGWGQPVGGGRGVPA